MNDLKNRVAIVTGGSAGIGLAIARRLIDKGARVVINARRREKLEQAAAELNGAFPNEAGPRCVSVHGDAADVRVIESMFAAAASAFGTEANAVVVNAGRGLSGSVLTSDTSEWEDMVRTNLIAAAHLMRAAGIRMSAEADKRGNGWARSTPQDIVVIGSIVGRHVSPFSSMYGSTKFGVHGITEGLRRELAPKGVRVTLVEPGFVTSEFQGVAGYKAEWFQGVVDRIGPVLEPDDVARPVAFVLGEPAHVHVSDFIVRPTRQDYP